MKPGVRGELILTLIRNHMRVLRIKHYEREIWTYEFEGPEKERFRYVGKKHLLFIGRTYSVRATCTNACDRDGFCVVERPYFRATPQQPRLFGD
jgi:hypothetical protein